MCIIRRACVEDASRIAEILVFNKRIITERSFAIVKKDASIYGY